MEIKIDQQKYDTKTLTIRNAFDKSENIVYVFQIFFRVSLCDSLGYNRNKSFFVV